MFHLLKKIFESGILVSGMTILWKYTNGCAKQYSCALDIYLITVISSSYGIIMDRAINLLCHGNHVFDGLNTTENVIWRGKWNLLVN